MTKEGWKMEKSVVVLGKEYLLEDMIYTPKTKESPFERLGGTYSLKTMEDGMEILVPNIKIPPRIEMEKLNRFGRARLKYLKEEKEVEYQMMYLEGTLMEHLLNIQEQVENFLEKEELKIKNNWKMTPQMQDQDFLKYAGLKKNLDMTLTRMAMERIIWI